MSIESEYSKYVKSENRFLASLFALPKTKSLDGFLYYKFSSQIEGYALAHDRREFLDTNNLTYELSLQEEEELNNGKFENLIKTIYNNFHAFLREFFISKNNFHDIELIKTFAKAIYFLKDHDKYYGYNEGRVISQSLNRNHFLSIIKRHTNELISELEWRINRLNPHNYTNFNSNDKECKMFFDSIITKGLILINKKKYRNNFEDIYNGLVPRFFSEETNTEEFSKIFSGKVEIFIDTIKWNGNTNSLSYFLRQLYKKHKLSNNKYFLFAEKNIVNQEGQNYSKLKDNKSIPNDATEIDSIVDLF